MPTTNTNSAALVLPDPADANNAAATQVANAAATKVALEIKGFRHAFFISTCKCFILILF